MHGLAQFEENNVSPDLKGGVLALGNFDGVHRGHQSVLKAAIDKARGLGIPSRVLTLEPHPRSVLKPDIAPFRLTPAKAKIRLLHEYGIDNVIVQNFAPEFAQMSGMDFAHNILAKALQVQHIVAGYDFVFGHNRDGNMKRLRLWLAAYEIGVTEVSPFRDHTGELVSSSRAREVLRQGDVEAARQILGRHWTISGKVAHGVKRGSAIGFPTANIYLEDYLRPRFGVYAITAGYPGAAHLWHGVANIGVRPTVDGKTELLEAHLFNFNGDLYDKELEVALVAFIRPEEAFTNIDLLRQQIARDTDAAKQKLAEVLK